MSPAFLAFGALLLLGGSVFLWFRRANDVPIPCNRTLFVAAWLGSAALGVTARAHASGERSAGRRSISSRPRAPGRPVRLR